MIANPIDTLRRLCQILGIDPDKQRVRSMVFSFASDCLPVVRIERTLTVQEAERFYALAEEERKSFKVEDDWEAMDPASGPDQSVETVFDMDTGKAYGSVELQRARQLAALEKIADNCAAIKAHCETVAEVDRVAAEAGYKKIGQTFTLPDDWLFKDYTQESIARMEEAGKRWAEKREQAILDSITEFTATATASNGKIPVHDETKGDDAVIGHIGDMRLDGTAEIVLNEEGKRRFGPLNFVAQIVRTNKPIEPIPAGHRISTSAGIFTSAGHNFYICNRCRETVGLQHLTGHVCAAKQSKPIPLPPGSRTPGAGETHQNYVEPSYEPLGILDTERAKEAETPAAKQETWRDRPSML